MENGNTSKEIKAIIQAIESSIGFKVATPRDFDLLKDIIFNHTSEYISSTTLKRIWGYLDEPLKTRESSLSILAKTLGYTDWKEFQNSYQNGLAESKSPSSPTFRNSINVNDDLKKDDEIMLYWFPDRMCRIRYSGEFQFEVIESENTRLKPGNTFSCHLIIEGEPLYLSGLIQNDSKPISYICGKLHGGVRYKKLKKKEV